MAIIRRGDLNRPLTIDEMDGNFTYLEELAGTGGGTAIGGTATLQSITDSGNTTSTIIIANGGIQGSTDFASYSIITPYSNDMKQVTLQVNGDGTNDIDTISMCKISMNPEEGISIRRSIAVENDVSIQFGPDTIYLTSISPGYAGYLTVTGDSIGIKTGSFEALLRSNDLSAARAFEFPDQDGTFALISDLPVDTGTPTLDEVLTSGPSSDKVLTIRDAMTGPIVDYTQTYYDSFSVLKNVGNFVPDGFKMFYDRLVKIDVNGGYHYTFPNVTGEVYVKNHVQYKALISQTGTNNPSVIILENTGLTASWVRDSTGTYLTNFPGNLEDKLFVLIGHGKSNSSDTKIVWLVSYNSKDDVTEIKILTFSSNGATPTDGILEKVSILIELYP